MDTVVRALHGVRDWKEFGRSLFIWSGISDRDARLETVQQHTALMETTSMVWWRNGSKDTSSPGDRSSIHWTVHKKVWWQTASGDMQNHHEVSGLITAVQ